MPALSTRKQLFILFFVVFFELLAYCLIIPAFGPLFLDTEKGILHSIASEDVRKYTYYSLMICYPLSQCFGAPMMGMISDKIGRKTVLTITLLSNFLGYLFATYAICTKEIIWIFLGFMISGLSGGNIPVSHSAIADLSKQSTLARNFSYVLTSYGFCYIIGSIIGGHLSSTTFGILPPYSLPFVCSSCLSLFNTLFVHFFFTETYTLEKKNKHYFTSWKTLKASFQNPRIWPLMGVIFLIYFGWNLFIKVLQVFLNERYGFLATENGYIFAYFGLCTVICQGLLMPSLSKKITSQRLVAFFSLLLSLSLMALPKTSSLPQFYTLFTLVAVGYAFILPNLTAIMSNLNHQTTQGKVMGINQGIQSFAKSSAPFFAIYLKNHEASLPAHLAGFFILMAWMIFLVTFQTPQPRELTT